MNKRINNVTLAALLTATICISSMLSVNIIGVSFSLALFGVFLSGLILKPIYALISNVVFILIGVVGLPVFANFNSGIGTILGPSGGFILSYPFVALIVSLLNIKFSQSFKKQYVYCFVSLLLCYILGTVWYSAVYKCSMKQALLVCVVPFILIDITKIFLSCYVAKIISNHIKK